MFFDWDLFDKENKEIANITLKLDTFQGLNKEHNGSISASGCDISSFEGCPEIINGYFYVASNNLTSLEFAPLYVNDVVDLMYNKLSSLEGIGRKSFREIGGALFLENNPIASNVLGIILIKRLQTFYFQGEKGVEYIVNNHMQNNRDLLECQEELITKGYKQYAKL